jgi:hypothetical protein
LSALEVFASARRAFWSAFAADERFEVVVAGAAGVFIERHRGLQTLIIAW